MKAPKSFYRDSEVCVSRHNITSYDGEEISCLLVSPKRLEGKFPCLIYIHGGGFAFEAAEYHYKNAIQYVKVI